MDLLTPRQRRAVRAAPANARNQMVARFRQQRTPPANIRLPTPANRPWYPQNRLTPTPLLRSVTTPRLPNLHIGTCHLGFVHSTADASADLSITLHPRQIPSLKPLTDAFQQWHLQKFRFRFVGTSPSTSIVTAQIAYQGNLGGSGLQNGILTGSHTRICHASQTSDWINVPAPSVWYHNVARVASTVTNHAMFNRSIDAVRQPGWIVMHASRGHAGSIGYLEVDYGIAFRLDRHSE